MKRAILAEEDRLGRQELADLLEDKYNFRVCQTSNGDTLVELAGKYTKTELIVANLDLRSGKGITEAIKDIREANKKLSIIAIGSGLVGSIAYQRALDSGANMYIKGSLTPKSLEEAIDKLA